ncbi:MAG: hypothetical protein QF416_05035 [Candidatus Marinimicrobia bacterium]|jgi:hypothetical protein|nr:hypothetical protein [Candidatus Neomarinimicrobiota bacterium]MDP7059810.1 hypothetical protein [Candidatus Neomarinimicrobiota bacterium]|tara:strand:+ start:15327 stop:15470 length:144 start_codon:yes stop_codon:yes gene_type:complete
MLTTIFPNPEKPPSYFKLTHLRSITVVVIDFYRHNIVTEDEEGNFSS